MVVVWRSLCFNDTATAEIYTLSLHDALPISHWKRQALLKYIRLWEIPLWRKSQRIGMIRRKNMKEKNKLFIDRKSTRLNSSHANISYAVFCLKKKTPTASPSHLSTSTANAQS